MPLTIHRKILLGFLLVIALMALSNAYILTELKKVRDAARLTLAADVRSIDLAKQLQTVLYDEEGYVQKFLVSQDQTYFDLYRENTRRFAQLLDTLADLQTSTDERALTARLQSSHQALADTLVTADFALDDSSTLSEQWRTGVGMLHRTLERLIGLNQLSISSAMADVDSTTQRSAKVALLLTFCTLLLALTIATVIARTITHPIAILTRGTDRFAKGKFEPVTISSNDEIALFADAFNEMGGKLKEMNEFKAELMAQITHELKTPLQTILIAHDMLASQRLGPMTAKQLDLLASIQQSTRTIATFGNQYLDLAKIEAGMMPFNLQPADITALLRGVVEELKLPAARREIRVELHQEGAVPPVAVDPEKITVVLRNLIGNAVKYSQPGGPVEIGVAPSPTGIAITIADRGIGIAGEELPHIFEKFYRSPNADSTGSKGTGLGLAIVKAFAEGHGGNVQVESVVGQGTTFTVELPAAPSPAPGDTTPTFDDA